MYKMIASVLILAPVQHIEEPGSDTRKFDTIMPTVVKPYSADTFLGEEVSTFFILVF